MNGTIEFRQAVTEDLDAIETIYDDIHSLEERGEMSIGWVRGVYPTRETAAEAIDAGELFVAVVDGRVVASGRINQHQEESYAQGSWDVRVPASQVLVLHTLTVSPEKSRGGIGSSFVEFFEQCARDLGCRSLRIDTQEKNSVARKMYARLGFTEVGIVDTDFQGIPGVRLVLLEKGVAPA